MKLADYLVQQELTPAAFAERLGKPPSTVTRWLRGERKPDLDSVVEIERETQGVVAAKDFVSTDAHLDGAASPTPDLREAVS